MNESNEGLTFFSEHNSALAVPNTDVENYAAMRKFMEANTTVETINSQLHIRLPATLLDVENLNKRTYPSHLMKEVVSDKSLQERASNGYLIGAGDDHPTTSYVAPINGSHIVSRVWVEKIGGKHYLMNEWKSLLTSKGKDLKALFESGASFGVSIRGFGATNNQANPSQGVMQKYKYLATDAVGDPSSQLYAGSSVPHVTLMEYIDPTNATEAKGTEDRDTKTENTDVQESDMEKYDVEGKKQTGPGPDGHTHEFDPNVPQGQTGPGGDGHTHDYNTRDGDTRPTNGHTHTIPGSVARIAPEEVEVSDQDRDKVEEENEDKSTETEEVVEDKDKSEEAVDEAKKEQDDDEDDSNGNGGDDKEDEDEEDEKDEGKKKKESTTASTSIPTPASGPDVDKKKKRDDIVDESLEDQLETVRLVSEMDKTKADEMIVELEIAHAEDTDALQAIKDFKEGMHSRRYMDEDDMYDDEDDMYDDDDEMLYDDDDMEYDTEYESLLREVGEVLQKEVKTPESAINALLEAIQNYDESGSDMEEQVEAYKGVVDGLRAHLQKEVPALESVNESQTHIIDDLRSALRGIAKPTPVGKVAPSEVKEHADRYIVKNPELKAYQEELYESPTKEIVTARARKYVEGIKKTAGGSRQLFNPNIGIKPTPGGEDIMPTGWR